MTTPPLLYQSRVRTAAKPVGQPRRKYPLPPGTPQYRTAYAFDQEFTQLLTSFPPAPQNTPANADSLRVYHDSGAANAILCNLSQPAHIGGGTGKYSGEFRIVPASWDRFITQVVTFPGIRDVAYTGGVRDPFAVGVRTRQRRDYFVVDPDNVAVGVKDSAGADIVRVNSAGAIPSLYRTPWKFLVSGAIQSGSEVTGLVKAGGITGWLETVPNTGTYLTWVATAAAFNNNLATQPWDADHPPVWNGSNSGSPAIATVGQYRFTDSRIEDYAGNIFCRVSEYVMPQ